MDMLERFANDPSFYFSICQHIVSFHPTPQPNTYKVFGPPMFQDQAQRILLATKDQHGCLLQRFDANVFRRHHECAELV